MNAPVTFAPAPQSAAPGDSLPGDSLAEDLRDAALDCLIHRGHCGPEDLAAYGFQPEQLTLLGEGAIAEARQLWHGRAA